MTDFTYIFMDMIARNDNSLTLLANIPSGTDEENGGNGGNEESSSTPSPTIPRGRKGGKGQHLDGNDLERTPRISSLKLRKFGMISKKLK